MYLAITQNSPNIIGAIIVIHQMWSIRVVTLQRAVPQPFPITSMTLYTISLAARQTYSLFHLILLTWHIIDRLSWVSFAERSQLHFILCTFWLSASQCNLKQCLVRTRGSVFISVTRTGLWLCLIVMFQLCTDASLEVGLKYGTTQSWPEEPMLEWNGS